MIPFCRRCGWTPASEGTIYCFSCREDVEAGANPKEEELPSSGAPWDPEVDGVT